MFINRKQAAYELIELLEKEKAEFDLVIGIPRGGVIPATIIAKHFNCLIDMVMVKKIGFPGIPDYSVGAVLPDGEILMHSKLKKSADIDMEELRRLADNIRLEANRRLTMYRNYRKPTEIKGRKVLLVDDGIVTGSTIKAAIRYIKRQKALTIQVATPVCSANTYHDLDSEVDNVFAINVAKNFYAVSQFYKDYTEVEDDEIIEMMKSYMTN